MRTFPVFLDMTSDPPLIFGGNSVAAAKARLLSLRATTIDVACDVPSPDMQNLSIAGKVSYVDLHPNISSIQGRPLVVAATGDDDCDAEISAIARALGVPVNVPDRPDLCSFMLPAIVDRGDVTVAIGTQGKSPVLAQRLRTWLEQELHPNLGKLAHIAGDFRDRAAAALPSGPRRRAFWETVFDGAAAMAAYAGRDASARQIINDALIEAGTTETPRAKVWLVGAGPGDPDLLTVKAVRALKSADVILYDSLAGPDILDIARREATMIAVGKRAGQTSTRQSTIHDLILEHARPGSNVVRLKGGDPLVFGRGGEELDALRKHDLDVEVVPGITAAIAAAASTQIPLTDRRHARTVTLLSGRGPGHGLADLSHINLHALRDGNNTLAIYMATRTGQQIARSLIEAGWSYRCPVLAVENVSLPSERCVHGRIDDLASDVNPFDLVGPAILIIGKVVGRNVDCVDLDLAPLLEAGSKATRELIHA